jgi:hypothetical protein
MPAKPCRVLCGEHASRSQRWAEIGLSWVGGDRWLGDGRLAAWSDCDAGLLRCMRQQAGGDRRRTDRPRTVAAGEQLRGPGRGDGTGAASHAPAPAFTRCGRVGQWSHFLTGSWLCWVCQCGVLPSAHSGGRWTVHVKSVSPGCCTDLQTLEPHGLLLVGTNADGVPRGGLERVLAVSTSLALAHQASRGLASDPDGSRRLRAGACSGSSQMKPRCLLVELSTDAEETGW